MQIAIDGPSGAGKSSVAKALSKKIHFLYVDTGALYRAIGFYVRNKGFDQKDNENIIKLLPEIQLELTYENGVQIVKLNGEALGDNIRTPEISMYASSVSAIPEVRTFLLETQRKIARENNVIMDGRDIGTVILPNADLKVFMTATAECRAERRCKELAEKGIFTTVEEVLADMKKRDEQDKNRAVEDAVLLDNTGFRVEDSVAAMEKIMKEHHLL